VRKLRLFGSYARGEANEDSDVNVLVLVDGLTGVLTPDDMALVSRVGGYRDLADYERTWEATEKVSAEAFSAVEPLIARARASLEADGLVVT
jgi:predicted nucleotidyltransferase